jgi:hypothetical protein
MPASLWERGRTEYDIEVGHAQCIRISTGRYVIKMRSQPVRSAEELHHEGYARYAFITPPRHVRDPQLGSQTNIHHRMKPV